MMTGFDTVVDPLADALTAAIDSVDARTEFYRLLLDARVYVLAARDATGKLVPIACEAEGGSSYVPFFSSLPLLRAAVTPNQPHTLLPFRELLVLMHSHLLWLNPLSANNKQFFPPENEFLLSKGVASTVIRDTNGEEVQMLLAHAPTELFRQTKALINSHLRAEEGVREAWLIQTYRPDLDTPPQLILGIHGENLPSELLVWCRDELARKLPGKPQIDILTCEAGQALSDYMKNEVDPVFGRGWMDKLFG